MPQHSAKKIYLFQIITLGLYFVYWCQRSGAEVNRKLGRKAVPTAWWVIVPFGVFWWQWQYTMALSELSHGNIKQADTFLIFVLVCYGWQFVLNYLTSFPFNLFANFVSKTTAILITVVIAYLTVVVAYAFYCSFVQKKLNVVA